jgi:hypothetical protein
VRKTRPAFYLHRQAALKIRRHQQRDFRDALHFVGHRGEFQNVAAIKDETADPVFDNLFFNVGEFFPGKIFVFAQRTDDDHLPDALAQSHRAQSFFHPRGFGCGRIPTRLSHITARLIFLSVRVRHEKICGNEHRRQTRGENAFG